jgi:tetratricopeptide (TPR) repeat protein
MFVRLKECVMQFTVGFLVLVLATGQPAFAQWEHWYQKGRQMAVEGNFSDARSLLSAALRDAERRALVGDNVAATLHELGVVSLDLGRNAEARHYLTRCLMLRRQPGYRPNIETAKTLNALAITHINDGNTQEADDLLRQALVILEKQVGRGDPDYAIALHNLGAIRAEQNRLGEALVLFEQSLSIFEQTTGADQLRILSTLANLAVIGSQLGRHEQANSWSARALQTAERQFAEAPETVARVLSIRAGVLKSSGRKREHKALERRAKELWAASQESTGPMHTVDASEFRQR